MPEIQTARMHTRAGHDLWDDIPLVSRDAKLGAFEQLGVEVPESWSQNATNIVAQKYFRGKLDSPKRESSVRQMIERVSVQIAEWGAEQGAFHEMDMSDAFYDELTFVLANQMAAFNSPVWFNVGFEEQPAIAACYILSCEDTFKGPDGIAAWQEKEMKIFLGGSGSGVNLSLIRSSGESLSKGGYASGPVSFMRGADSWAGTIKSGGKTRRAAKMVILDVDHPDISEFVWCKALEERKAHALVRAGFSGGMDGDVLSTIQYQNANNSVRLSDRFMRAASAGEQWQLVPRNNGEPTSVSASDLLDEIAQASWECADPGVQFDTTINVWHTTPHSGRINGSNPCSEFMSNDNSACNLASLNLMKFACEDGTFDIESFRHTVDVMAFAMDVMVEKGAYPTQQIADNARDYRQLGIGYTNLGALLMTRGLPYDSDEGRALAASVTALMNARAWRRSAEMARDMGPYAAFEANAASHLEVMHKHYDAIGELPPEAPIVLAAAQDMSQALALGGEYGFRNAQMTVLAPTGTISFLMDCDTTGIEPDYALVKSKALVGGGTMEIINSSIPLALASLGYRTDDVERMAELIKAQDGDVTNVVSDEHIAVFDTARTISPMGHVRMMEAVQPFLSGAISKTVNMPSDTRVSDVREIIIEGWKRGLKSLAIYRDGSKAVQALSARVEPSPAPPTPKPYRRKLPDTRRSITHKVSLDGHEGYVTMGMHDDGTLGEVFVTGFGKEGSAFNGLLGFSSTLLSIALQYGVPLEDLARKFRDMRFEPAGLTENPEIRVATSLPDYIMRLLVSRFGDVDLQEELGVMTDAVKARLMDAQAIETEHDETLASGSALADFCVHCGGLMIVTGTCSTCSACATSSGGCS